MIDAGLDVRVVAGRNEGATITRETHDMPAG
jgi:hypothetical protein